LSSFFSGFQKKVAALGQDQIMGIAYTLPDLKLIAKPLKIADMIWIREWDSYDGDILGTRDKRKPVTFSTQTPLAFNQPHN